MDIETIVVGPLETNCYIITKDNKCLIVDPGDESNKIIKAIDKKEVLGILLTHSHFDHIGALNEIKDYYNVLVYDYNNEKNIEIGPFNFEIIDTKGHKEDSITFYFEEDKVMFTGDFLFKGSIGRMDLEGGNEFEMDKSINLIKTYPDDITIYPGHGPKTNLLYEKNFNPYF